MAQTLKDTTATATRWSSITEVVAKFVMPIVNIILARLLTPEAFGVVATVTMIVSFAEIFADAGFQKYIIQHDFKNKEELDQNTDVAFWTNLFISILCWLLIFIWSDRLATLVGNPGLGVVVWVAALSLPLLGLSSIQMARFKRDFDFKSLFFVRLVSICTPLVVTVPIAYFTHSYWALIIGTLSGNAVNAFVLTIKSQWRVSLHYSFRQLKEMFSYSWWILMESISVWMTSYADTFIVSIYLSTYYVGIYKTSMVTVNQITGLITAATSMPLFVALTRLKDNRIELISTYNGYIQAIALFVFPLSAGIWLYRDFVTSILLGGQWGEAVEFIGLWGLLSSISLVLGTYANGLYNAVGKTFLSFSVATFNLIIMIGVLCIAAPQGYGMLYVSRSLLRFVFVISQLFVMGVVLKYPIWSLIRKLAPPFLCTLGMFIVSFFLRSVHDSVLWTIFTIIIAIFVYFAMGILFFRNIFVDAFKTLGIPLPNKILSK